MITLTSDALIMTWPVIVVLLAVDVLILLVMAWFRHRTITTDRDLAGDDHAELVGLLTSISNHLSDSSTTHQEIANTLVEIRDREDN
jgi:hypothetical protein